MFHDGETWNDSLTMASAGVFGSAAVGTAVFGLFCLHPAAVGAASMLWRGAHEAGEAYAQNATGLLKRVSVCIGWGEMELTIREGEYSVEVWSGDRRL